jgi:hypothetical protein
LQRLHCRRPDGSRPMCLHVGWSGMSLCSPVIGLVLGQDPASRTVSRLDYNSLVPAWYYCPAAPLLLPEQPRLLRALPTCLERAMYKHAISCRPCHRYLNTHCEYLDMNVPRISNNLVLGAWQIVPGSENVHYAPARADQPALHEEYISELRVAKREHCAPRHG